MRKRHQWQDRQATQQDPPRQELIPARQDLRSRRGWCKRKKWYSVQYILSAPFCKGPGQDILVCKNCSSASLWPRGSCATIFRHMKLLSSLASHCNGSCRIQKQPAGLWSGHWSCRALASNSKALRQSRAEPWRSSLQNGPQRRMKTFKKQFSPARELVRNGPCTLTGPFRCKALVLACCLSHPPESTSSI